MATVVANKLVLRDYPAGAGTMLRATARGTFLISCWTAAGGDLNARVQKTGDDSGVILSQEIPLGSTAGLQWTPGVGLTVTSSVPVHRYGTALKI